MSSEQSPHTKQPTNRVRHAAEIGWRGVKMTARGINTVGGALPRQTVKAGREFASSKRRKHAGVALALLTTATTLAVVVAEEQASDMWNRLTTEHKSAASLPELFLTPEEDLMLTGQVAPFLAVIPPEAQPVFSLHQTDAGRSGFEVSDNTIEIVLDHTDTSNDPVMRRILATAAALMYTDTVTHGALTAADQEAITNIPFKDRVIVDSHFGDNLSPSKLIDQDIAWNGASQGIKVTVSALVLPDLLTQKLAETQPLNVPQYKEVIGTHLHMLQPFADHAGLTLTEYLKTIGMDPAFLTLAA